MKLDITPEDGALLISIARASLKAHFTGAKVIIPEEKKDLMKETPGVFIVLRTFPGYLPRGESGYLPDVMPLEKAIQEVSIAAATRDSLISPVSRKELDKIILELSLITDLELLKREEYLEKIEIRKHGVIVSNNFKGIILPQVAMDMGWNNKAILSHACMKAKLNPDAWKESGIKVYRFRARVFLEIEPEGNVIERELLE